MSKWLKHTRQEGECLIWTRCLNSDGYPRAGDSKNSNIKVHREVFFDTCGYYPEVVRHSCDNPKCINPEHLVGGTYLDNLQDRQDRKRTHNYVDQQLYETRFELRSQGKLYKEIAETLGMKIKRVEYILTRWRKES